MKLAPPSTSTRGVRRTDGRVILMLLFLTIMRGVAMGDPRITVASTEKLSVTITTTTTTTPAPTTIDQDGVSVEEEEQDNYLPNNPGCFYKKIMALQTNQPDFKLRAEVIVIYMSCGGKRSASSSETPPPVSTTIQSTVWSMDHSTTSQISIQEGENDKDRPTGGKAQVRSEDWLKEAMATLEIFTKIFGASKLVKEHIEWCATGGWNLATFLWPLPTKIENELEDIKKRLSRLEKQGRCTPWEWFKREDVEDDNSKTEL